MVRRIASFVRDDQERWVARLECGHHVHVPPDAHPPAPEWSRTEHGRKNLVGSLLRCPACAAGAVAMTPSEVDRPAPRQPVGRRSLLRPRGPRSRLKPTWMDSRLAWGPLFTVQDLERLSRLGFRSVICLDLAGEPGQGLSPHVEASWVRALGMTPRWIPVDPARIRVSDVDRFLEVAESVRGPAFVHSSGDQRAMAFSAIRLGRSRAWSAAEAILAATRNGGVIGGHCAEVVRVQVRRLLARDPEQAEPHRCFTYDDPPHVPRWDEPGAPAQLRRA